MNQPAVLLQPGSLLFDIFPAGEVPVTTFTPVAISTQSGLETGYMIDLDRCEPERVGAIAMLLADVFGTRLIGVMACIEALGVPIRLGWVARHPEVVRRAEL